MKKKLSIFAVIAVIAIAVIVFATNRTNANEDVSRAEYQKVLDEFNAEYGYEYEIADMDMFANNIINSMTVEEFKLYIEENLLLSDDENTLQKSSAKDYDFSTGEAFPSGNKKKVVTKGYAQIARLKEYVHGTNGRVGLVYADFDIVDLTTYCYFSSYVSGGYYNRDNQWFFYTTSDRAVSLTQTKAVIEYKGSWMFNGMMESTIFTYQVTYTPRMP